MENSRNKYSPKFKLHIVLSTLMKSHTVLFHSTQDINYSCVSEFMLCALPTHYSLNHHLTYTLSYQLSQQYNVWIEILLNCPKA